MDYEEERKKAVNWIKRGVIFVLVLLAIVIGCFKFLERIDNGYVGVRFSPNGGVKSEALQPGVKWVGIDKVTQYPIRLQTIQAKNVALSTSDGKKTVVNIKYDYKVDPKKATKMYKEFGNVTSEDIEKGWLKSRLQKTAREVYSKYSLLDVLSGKSSEVEGEVLKRFADSVEGKGFLVENVTVGVPDVDPETQKSIDAIIRSGQEAKKAELDAKTQKTQAETEATKVTLKAEAEAKAIREKANAQAEANKKIAESVTDELVKYEEAQARKSHGWVETVVGDGSSTIVDGNK